MMKREITETNIKNFIEAGGNCGDDPAHLAALYCETAMALSLGAALKRLATDLETFGAQFDLAHAEDCLRDAMRAWADSDLCSYFPHLVNDVADGPNNWRLDETGKAVLCRGIYEGQAPDDTDPPSRRERSEC